MVLSGFCAAMQIELAVLRQEARANFAAGAVFDEAPLCVECHYSRQAQYLGRLYLHVALFALARLREVLLLCCVCGSFRAILRSRRNI